MIRRLGCRVAGCIGAILGVVVSTCGAEPPGVVMADGEAVAAVRAGMIFESSGHLDEAVACFEKASACQAMAEAMRLRIACVQVRRNEIAEAAAAMEKLLSMGDGAARKPAGTTPVPAQWLGVRTKGQIARDIQQIQARLMVQPGDWRLRYLLASAYGNVGQLDLFVQEFHTASQLNRDCAEYHRGLAGLSLMQGKSQEAMRHFVDAVKAEPENVRCVHHLAMLSIAGKDLAAAEKVLREALSGEQKSGILLADLAMVAGMRGDRAGAKDLLGQFRQTMKAAGEPDLAGMRQAAKVYLALGDKDSGMGLLQKVVAGDPDDPETKELAEGVGAAEMLRKAQEQQRATEAAKRLPARRKVPDELRRFVVEHVGPAAVYVHDAFEHLADGCPERAAWDLRAAMAIDGQCNTARFLLSRVDSKSTSVNEAAYRVKNWSDDQVPYGRSVCGAVATSQFLGFRGKATERFALAERLGYLRGQNVSVWEIAQGCEPEGYEGMVFAGSLDAVKSVLQERIPLIAVRRVFWNVDYSSHACMAVGFDETAKVVLLNDPDWWQDQVVPYGEVGDVLWIAMVPKGTGDDLAKRVAPGRAIAEQFLSSKQAALRDPAELDRLLSERNGAWRESPAAVKVVAAVLLGSRRSDKAKELLEPIVARNPLDAYGQYMLGSAYLLSGQSAMAAARFEAALRIRPSYAPAVHAYAVAVSGKVALQQAERHLKEVLLASPLDLEAYYSLGVVWAKQGQIDRAKDALNTYAKFASEGDVARARRVMEQMSRPATRPAN